MPARFYLDEDVAYRTTVELRSAGHDAVHVSELGTKGRNDAFHVLEAFQQNRILVIYNAKHYRVLSDAWLTWHPAPSVPVHRGILCVPPLQPELLRDFIVAFLASHATFEYECHSCDRLGSWKQWIYKP